MKKLGADHVIDHTQSLQPQIGAPGFSRVTHVASLNSTESYFDSYVEVLDPQKSEVLVHDIESVLAEFKPAIRHVEIL